MPLDSLLALVGKIRERIRDHGPALRQSEALTRYALIDPLLRELGWDTGDPDLVVPEYKTDDGWPDYALLSDGKPIMMVEAKKLDTSLQGKVIRQGIGYCQEQGTLYFSVTDGRLWKIYETHRPVPVDEKRIAEFDLKNQSAAEACLKALTLWEIKESGRVGDWYAPGVGRTPNQPAQPPSPIPNPQPPSPGLDEHEWQPISELKPRSESHPSPPKEVQFPDNSGAQVTAWGWLLVEVARWLIKGNHLAENHCPIPRTPGGIKSLVTPGPVDPTGRYTQVESLYIYTNLTHGEIINACRTIIKRVGQDPTQFKVRFS